MQTVNLALSKSFGAHAAEACVVATPKVNRAPKAAIWQRKDRRRRCLELFITAEGIMPRHTTVSARFAPFPTAPLEAGMRLRVGLRLQRRAANCRSLAWGEE